MIVIVYVVIGGWKFEGSDAESIGVFSDRDTAVAYGESLLVGNRYDSYEIVER